MIDAAAGLAHRLLDGLGVERQQRAQVDDLGVDAGLVGGRLGHVDHRPVGEHRDVAARAPHHRLAERDVVVAIGHLAERVGRPRHDRLLVVPVERPVVQALRFEEDHGIVVLDRRDEQALGVVGRRRQHRLQPAHVREQALRALAVRLTAVDATASRHAHGDRCGELGTRPVAQASRLGDQLVHARVDVVGELDLGDRPQPIGAHPDGDADDPAFGDRGVEHSVRPVLRLQAFGAAEDAAEVADVLAEDDDVVVTLEHHVERRPDGDVHRHRRHVSPPRARAAGVAGATACP